MTQTRDRVPCEICRRHSLPGRFVCSRCNLGIGLQRGECAECGKPGQLLDHAVTCGRCRAKRRNRCFDCGRSGLSPNRTTKICGPCALRRHLDTIIPAEPVGALAEMRPAILAADPVTTTRWLNRTRALLVDLNEGRVPLDHAVLDDLPRPKSVEHLRALLIAVGILPPDPLGPVRRLEAAVGDMVSVLPDPNDKIVTRWLRWKVIPRLRRGYENGLDLLAAVRTAKRQIRQVVTFLDVLGQRPLGELAQHEIDDWFAGPGAMRWDVRAFLAWAQQPRDLPARLDPPPSRQEPRASPTDAEERWIMAKQLLTDESHDPVDRVAGLLVCLYAQPLSRIVTLTTDDVLVTDTRVQLRLGEEPLHLPEPLAALVQQLPIRRRAGTVETLPTTWLFAGFKAGAHLHATVLGARLRAIGVEPRRMRVAPPEQPARELAPAVLADVLGLPVAAAVRANRRTAGQWAPYAGRRQG